MITMRGIQVWKRLVLSVGFAFVLSSCQAVTDIVEMAANPNLTYADFWIDKNGNGKISLLIAVPAPLVTAPTGNASGYPVLMGVDHLVDNLTYSPQSRNLHIAKSYAYGAFIFSISADITDFQAFAESAEDVLDLHLNMQPLERDRTRVEISLSQTSLGLGGLNSPGLLSLKPYFPRKFTVRVHLPNVDVKNTNGEIESNHASCIFQFDIGCSNKTVSLETDLQTDDTVTFQFEYSPHRLTAWEWIRIVGLYIIISLALLFILLGLARVITRAIRKRV